MTPARFGKYLLVDRISAGHLAEVFLAQESGLGGNRVLAIKRLQATAASDEEVKRAFLDEARISLALSHANIVHVLEVAETEDAYFLAMEYVSGKSLAQVLAHHREQGTTMSLPQAMFIAAKVCDGLDYAHRRKDPRGNELGIVHRGVSPQNVLLSYDGDVKLIDFGLAKATNRLQKTQVGILKGKVGYMSPEQVRGQPVDRRTDIFAAGTLLYEMVTGKRPFDADSDFALMEQVAKADYTPATQVNPYLPDAVDAVLGVALTPVSSERYQHASDFAAELMKYLLSEETPYTVNALSNWMRATFAADLEAELSRLQQASEATAPGPGDSGVRKKAAARPAASKKASGLKPARTVTPPPVITQPEVPALPPEDVTAVGMAPSPPDDDFDPPTQIETRFELPKPPPRSLPVVESGDALFGGATPWRDVSPPPAFDGLPELDLPERRPEPASPPPPASARPSRAKLVVAAALVLAVLGGGAWAYTQWAAGPSAGGHQAVVMVQVTPVVPQTQITLGGRLVQSGVVASFPAGDYDLVVTAPGFKQHSQRVKIFDNEQIAGLSVFLEPEEAAAPPAAPQFEAVFDAPEGTRIYLDGTLIGTTPGVRARGLTVGKSYRYRAEKEGFVDKLDTLTSSVAGERTVKVELAAEPPRPAKATKPSRTTSRSSDVGPVGFLVVSSDPEGAAVWVDGKPTSRRTPIPPSSPLAVPVGTRKIVLEVGGIRSEVQVVQVKKDQTVTLEDVVLDNIGEL